MQAYLLIAGEVVIVVTAIWGVRNYVTWSRRVVTSNEFLAKRVDDMTYLLLQADRGE